MGVFSRVVNIVLIVQILLGSNALVYAQTENRLPPAPPTAEATAAEIDQAAAVEPIISEKEMGRSADPLNLKDQKVRITTYKKYLAGKKPLLESDEVESVVEIPLERLTDTHIPPVDFQHGVQTTLNPEAHTLTFSFWEKNIKYEHEINHVTPFSFGIAGDTITFLDGKRGRTIHTGLAQDLAFRAPIPNGVTLDFKRGFKVGEKIEITPVISGMTPWTSISPDAIFPKGHIPDQYGSQSLAFIEIKGNERILRGLYDFKTVRLNLLGQLVYLALAATPFADPRTKLYERLARIVPLVDNAQINDPSEYDSITQNLILILGAKFMDPILKAALSNHRSMLSPKDMLTAKLIEQNLEAIHREAERQSDVAYANRVKRASIINLELGRGVSDIRPEDGPILLAQSKVQNNEEIDQNSIFKFARSGLTPKTMRMFTTFVAGGVAALGAYYGGAWLIQHQNELWLGHIFYNLYDHVVPAAARDLEYLRLLPRNWIVNMMWMPALGALSYLAMKASSTETVPYMALLRTYGRLVSVVAHSWLDRLTTGILRMPNFMEALRQNINPFESDEIIVDEKGKIKLADQNAGENKIIIRPGLDEVPRGTDRREILARNAEVLDLKAKREIRKRAFIVRIALLASCPQEGIDEAFAGALLKRGKIPTTSLYKLMNDPDFREEVIQMREELDSASAELMKAHNWDDLDLDPKLVIETYGEAQKVIEFIKSRSDFKSAVKALQRRVHDVQKNTLPVIGKFSIADADAYRTLDPSRQSKNLKTYARGAVPDAFITPTQKLLFGARAKSEDIVRVHDILVSNRLHGTHLPFPDGIGLAARPDFFATNREYAPEPAAQELGLAYSAAAYVLSVQSDQGTMANKIYAPVESASLAGEVKSDDFFTGLWEIFRESTKWSAHEGADYEWRSAKIRYNSAYWLFSFNLSIRRLFGQPLLEALKGYGYSFGGMSQILGGGWIWDTSRNGIQKYQDRKARERWQLANSRRILSKALRFNNPDEIREGYRDLFSFAESNLPPEVAGAKSTIQEITAMSLEDFEKYRSEFKSSPEFESKWGAKIEDALTYGNIEKVEALDREIKSDVSSADGYTEIDKKRAEFFSAIAYSLRNLPKTNAPNQAAINVVSYGSSIFTTFLNGFIVKMTLASGVQWSGKYLALALIVPAFHGATFAAQSYMRKNVPLSAIDDKFDRIANFCKNALHPKGKAPFSLPGLPKPEGAVKVRQSDG